MFFPEEWNVPAWAIPVHNPQLMELIEENERSRCEFFLNQLPFFVGKECFTLFPTIMVQWKMAFLETNILNFWQGFHFLLNHKRVKFGGWRCVWKKSLRKRLKTRHAYFFWLKSIFVYQ